MTGARSGAGRLSRAALYRMLPVASHPHSRENRLRRFLDNRRLEGRAVITGLSRLLLARGGRGFWPVLIDQTRIGTVEALVAAAPFEGRAVPCRWPCTPLPILGARWCPRRTAWKTSDLIQNGAGPFPRCRNASISWL